MVLTPHARQAQTGGPTHQVMWTELLEHAVVLLLINPPLVIDPAEGVGHSISLG